jgi:hypothetical protein
MRTYARNYSKENQMHQEVNQAMHENKHTNEGKQMHGNQTHILHYCSKGAYSFLPYWLTKRCGC